MHRNGYRSLDYELRGIASPAKHTRRTPLLREKINALMSKKLWYEAALISIGILLGLYARGLVHEHKQESNWELANKLHWAIDDKLYYQAEAERWRHEAKYQEARYLFYSSNGHRGREIYEVAVKKNLQ